MLGLSHFFLLRVGGRDKIVHQFQGSLANSPSSLDLSEISFGCLTLFLGYIVALIEGEQEDRSINYLIWTGSLLCAI